MSALRKYPITPIAIGAAWLLLTNGPPSVRESVSQYLSPQQIETLLKAFKWLFALDALVYTNSSLNQLALNNFKSSTKSKWTWSNEIAVVTGASSGFGKLFSQDLASKGIKVVALDISDPPATLSSNPKITFFKCDVTSVEQVKQVAQKIRSTVGNPTILINNAGIASTPHTILTKTPDSLDKILGVNLKSHYYMCQEFVPYMVEKKKGHIFTIASAASFVAMPQMVDYSITKAGVQAFHEGLHAELRSLYGAPEINMTIVHPDWADTNIIAPYKKRLEKAGESILDPQDVSDAVVNQILSGRSGRLLLGGRVGLASRFRFLPDWVTWLVRQGMEKRTPRIALPPQKNI